MKAAVLEAFQQPLVVREVPDPVAGPRDAVIRVEGESICRSDWHVWMGDWEWIRLKPSLPIILGHEMAGVVEEVGAAVQQFKRGDRVLVPVVLCCMACEYCLRGRQNLCLNSGMFGTTDNGGYGQYVRVPNADANLVRLPDSMDFLTAAAMGCRFPTAYHALRDQGQIRGGDWVAVHGCGGVGLSAVHIASALGANVIAVDIAEEKLAKAREMGAVAVVNASEAKVPRVVKQITDGGAHVSLDALGSAVTCTNSVLCLRRGGRHIQVGLTSQAEKGLVALPVDLIASVEIEFIGSAVHPQSGYPSMLAMVESGKLDPAKLVTRTISIEEASPVLESMTEFGTLGMVVINRW